MITDVGPPVTRPRGSLSLRASSYTSSLRHLDWVLLSAVLALCVLGSLLVWSATRTQLIEAGADPQSFLLRHTLNLAIGTSVAAVVTFIDYRMIRVYAPLIYVASCLGLVAVLTPLGATINGSHSWIVLGGGLQLQPSEFAKVAVIAVLAMVLGELRDGENTPRDLDVVQALVLAAVPMVLILLQPDLGTTLIFGVVIFAMIAISGARRRWILGLILGVAVGAYLSVRFQLLEPYQMQRFLAFTDPSVDPRGAGYNANQARIAVGSGGFFGKGLFNGQQTHGQFVPEQQTDFIFTVAGEELGFLGAGGIVALLGIVVWRALRIAARAEDLFGTLLATGIACWIAFQSFQSIGMTLGIMPITGLPLPLVSYGGSAVLATLVAVGILESVHMSRRR